MGSGKGNKGFKKNQHGAKGPQCNDKDLILLTWVIEETMLNVRGVEILKMYPFLKQKSKNFSRLFW